MTRGQLPQRAGSLGLTAVGLPPQYPQSDWEDDRSRTWWERCRWRCRSIRGLGSNIHGTQATITSSNSVCITLCDTQPMHQHTQLLSPIQCPPRNLLPHTLRNPDISRNSFKCLFNPLTPKCCRWAECHSAQMSIITKWRLNPDWHRMLYSCTNMVTVGVKGLRRACFSCAKASSTLEDLWWCSV